MTKRFLVPLIPFLVLAAGPGAAASDPHITDPAGDANGTGLGEDTRPASYDDADLVAVDLETDFIRVPDEEDPAKTRVVPTALVLRLQVTGTLPSSYPLRFEVEATTGSCTSQLRGYVGTRPPVPPGSEAGSAEWVQFGADCPDALEPYSSQGMGVVAEDSRWTATVSEGGSEVVLRYPFDSLTKNQAALLGPGATLASPRALSSPSSELLVAWSGVPVLDETAAGGDFTVGEDLPAD